MRFSPQQMAKTITVSRVIITETASTLPLRNPVSSMLANISMCIFSYTMISDFFSRLSLSQGMLR